jgi:HlyD family secretion protein
MKIKTQSLILLVLLTLVISACSTAQKGDSSTGLTASGFIAADEVRVAPEASGKVTEITVSEGDSVQSGEVLFSLDDEVVLAQVNQAQAAANTAGASLDAANAQLAAAQAQYDVIAQQARLADQQNRDLVWNTTSLQVSDLPVWYFQKDELMSATQAEVEVASQDLKVEQANLDEELKKASNADFIGAENRLAQAQAAYTSADRTLQQANAAFDNTELVTAAQEQLDAARAELDAAKLVYDRMLSTIAAEAVKEARARLSVAQAHYDQSIDMLTGLQTGADSLQVKAAKTAVNQAETAVALAQANQAQAQAALDLVKLQQPRMIVKAPVAGVVLSSNFKAGELVSAGSVVLTLGNLDEVGLTVYVPEDKYGQVSLGQNVSITADSIPNRQFTGKVEYISDQAEFTPRNVQTAEGRQSTVYAVKIMVPNPDQALKPGMPADVDFNLP